MSTQTSETPLYRITPEMPADIVSIRENLNYLHSAIFGVASDDEIREMMGKHMVIIGMTIARGRLTQESAREYDDGFEGLVERARKERGIKDLHIGGRK